MPIIRSKVTGEISSSRAFMWFFSGAAFVICWGIVTLILLDQLKIYNTDIEWEPFEGPMSWMRDLVFISILSFLGNEAANAYQNKKSVAAVNVDTVEQVDVGDTERS